MRQIANLLPKTTGLPFAIRVSPKGTARCDVRVNVYAGPNAVGPPVAIVAIQPTVHIIDGKLSRSDIAALAKWVQLNRDVLIRLWEGEFHNETDAVAAFHPIRRHNESVEDYVDPRFLDDSDGLFYMTEIDENATGLPFKVWVAFANFGGVEHNMRVWTGTKYPSLPSEMNCIAVSPNVRVLRGSLTEHDLNSLREWLALNMDVLQKHWNGDIGSADVFNQVRSITLK